MKSTIRLLITISTVFMLSMAIPVRSQDIVIVRIAPPAPNQLSAADLWQVELTNLARTPLEVFLIGTVEVDRSGLILEARSSNFQLMPGLNRLTGREVQPVKVNYVTSRYRDAVMRTGNFPAGIYILCATAYDVESRRELGRDCIYHSVQPFSPPQLVAPVYEEAIHHSYPVFSWTPLAPMPPDATVHYRIKMVKVLRTQPPESALQTNVSWFEFSNLMTTTLSYPPEARPFEEGTYAWFVEAVELRTGQMLARSEVGVFRWESPKMLLDPGLIATIAPHGIPAALFEALMSPCIDSPEIPLRKDVIESQND